MSEPTPVETAFQRVRDAVDAPERCPYHVRRNHACHICARISKKLLAELEVNEASSRWLQLPPSDR